MKRFLKSAVLLSFLVMAVVLFMPEAKAYTVSFSVGKFEVAGGQKDTEPSGSIVGKSSFIVAPGEDLQVTFSPRKDYEWGSDSKNDGSIFCSNELDLTKFTYDNATNTLKYTNFQGATDVNTKYECVVTFVPCEPAPTGDYPIFLIAGLAVLGLGAFVVFSKKKSYN